METAVKPVQNGRGRKRRWPAEQGKAVAQYNLGALCGNGLGVPKDCVQALTWLILAAAQGNKEASDARDKLAQEMASSQIEEAERLAREWKPKKNKPSH